MPELPEAETIARELDERLSGRTIHRVVHLRGDMLHGSPLPKVFLPGRRIEAVRRRGKRIVFQMQPTATMVVRLGMSGRLTACTAEHPPDRHTHLRLSFLQWKNELRFRDPRRFGGVWLYDQVETEQSAFFKNLGPEPLEITLALFGQVLRRPRQVKALLMDQAAIAGMGNIYCDESLHAAGIHPLTLADSLDAVRVRRLLRAIRTTLRRAIRFNGTTLMDYRRIDGEAGSFQRFHRVYGREGRPCRTCRAPVVRIQAAGRSTYFCKHCQRPP
jgi:formamidopyrimidine-DNA glycosylase